MAAWRLHINKYFYPTMIVQTIDDATDITIKRFIATHNNCLHEIAGNDAKNITYSSKE